MSPDEKKRLVMKFYTDIINSGDGMRLGSYISEDYIDHNSPGTDRGASLVLKHMEGIRRTFPDLQLHVERLFCDGDFVISQVIAHGTHLGEWMGIRPTGRKIRLKGINIDRLDSGKIVEHWGEADTVGMLVQMGVDPFAGQVMNRQI